MTVRTVPLLDLAVVLRKPFTALVTQEGAPIGDRQTGEPIWLAEAVAPGLVPGRFTIDDRPSTIRIKVVGAQPEDIPAGNIAQLANPKLTVWYQPRARGVDARSAVTISCDRVERAPAGTIPVVRGGIPAHTAGVGAMFLGQHDQQVDVMFDAAGVFSVEGVTEVRFEGQTPPSLIGQQVTLGGLRAYYSQPDPADVSQRSKAELYLACSTIDPIATAAPPAGRPGKRGPDTEPVAELASTD